MLGFAISKQWDWGPKSSWESGAEEMGVVECVHVDNVAVKGVVNNILFCLVRLNPLLNDRPNAGCGAFGLATIMLGIEDEFDVLGRVE